MKRTLEEKIEEAVRRYNLLFEGAKVLVAVSGGPDSVFLLYCLLKLSPRYKLQLAIAHLNHMLRGNESDKDEVFVKKLAEEFKLPYFGGRIDVKSYAKSKKLNLEDAARELRYRFLEEKLAEWNGDLIATGHTLSDSVETFFLNLLRGTDLSGLKGISPKLGKVIRPLILVTRDEILQYLRDKNIPFRIDSSNYDTTLSRNYLRHKVFPLLREKFGDFEKRIGRTCELLREESDFLFELTEELVKRVQKPSFEDEVILDRYRLLEEHPVIVRWALHRITAAEHRAICLLLGVLKRGGRASLPGGLKVESSMGDLRFYRRERALSAICDLDFGVIELPEINLRLKIERTDDIGYESRFRVYFPENQLKFPLSLRKRKPGDRMKTKIGMKKLKEIFIDRKIPRWRRDLIPVIEDNEKIIWVVGIEKTHFKKSSGPFVKMEVEKYDDEKFWVYDL